MANDLEVLQAEVLRLSPSDRAHLLDRLIATLDVDSSVGASCVADEREQDLISGAVAEIELDVAIARLEERFPIALVPLASLTDWTFLDENPMRFPRRNYCDRQRFALLYGVCV